MRKYAKKKTFFAIAIFIIIVLIIITGYYIFVSRCERVSLNAGQPKAWLYVNGEKSVFLRMTACDIDFDESIVWRDPLFVVRDKTRPLAEHITADGLDYIELVVGITPDNINIYCFDQAICGQNVTLEDGNKIPFYEKSAGEYMISKDMLHSDKIYIAICQWDMHGWGEYAWCID